MAPGQDSCSGLGSGGGQSGHWWSPRTAVSPSGVGGRVAAAPRQWVPGRGGGRRIGTKCNASPCRRRPAARSAGSPDGFPDEGNRKVQWRQKNAGENGKLKPAKIIYLFKKIKKNKTNKINKEGTKKQKKKDILLTVVKIQNHPKTSKLPEGFTRADHQKTRRKEHKTQINTKK